VQSSFCKDRTTRITSGSLWLVVALIWMYLLHGTEFRTSRMHAAWTWHQLTAGVKNRRHSAAAEILWTSGCAPVICKTLIDYSIYALLRTGKRTILSMLFYGTEIRRNTFRLLEVIFRAQTVPVFTIINSCFDVSILLLPHLCDRSSQKIQDE
jgi:hypothetical protein